MAGNYYPLAVEEDDSKDSVPLSPPFPSRPRTPLFTPRQGRVVATLVAVLAFTLLFLAPDLRHGISSRIARHRGAGEALPLPEHTYFGDSPHSPPRLWGPGLSTARQNVAATFFIDFDETTESPLAVNESISVVLDGPARFAASIVYAGKGRFVASYTPYDAGDYILRAELFQRTLRYTPYPYWRPLGLDSYNLTVTRQDGSLARGSGRQELAFPRDRCTGEEDTTEGRWVRCEDTPLACVRYGWIWLPRTCYFHIYTAEELVEQDLWIAVVGTSVWRGIFFAGLDHLLGERAANLSAPSSQFWKCWGRFSAETQQLRLSYLDFREECTTPGNQGICVGEYLKNTETMLGLLGREREGRGPDLVLWEINYARGANVDTLPRYRKFLGEAWDGTFIATSRTHSPEVLYDPALAQVLTHKTSTEPENKIEVMDISTMGASMFDTMEFPHDVRTSFHWHGQCNFAGMHSCSPVNDMIFQMALNIATYRQRNSPRPSLLSAPPSPSLGSELRFCLQCPPKLDFSMRPEVEPECYDSLPASE